MPWNVKNKILPIVGTLTILALLFVLFKSCTSDSQSGVQIESVPIPPAPDADSPADTIKTLTANVSELINEVEALRKDNEQLHDQRKDLEQSISTQVASEISEYRQRDASIEQYTQTDIVELQSQIDDLLGQIDKIAANLPGSDIPLGIGLDELAMTAPAEVVENYVWIDPLDASDTVGTFGMDGSIPNTRPVYTIPRNATLIGSTVMTALIGRIPREGHVRDPMPFKILTGRENLAANGLKLDRIEGMVWSGYAVGDWTLSCVSGRLESVTFVFEDGTIRTVSTTGSSQSSQDALGWISDEYGVPCVAGQRKSNANAYLAQQSALNAAQAAANAAAALETTQSVDALGAHRSSVTGEMGRYVLGKTLAGGMQATAGWLTQRGYQEFDAIFVQAGQSVAIHVDQEIQIDYEREGRKLSHDEIHTPHLAVDLD